MNMASISMTDQTSDFTTGMGDKISALYGGVNEEETPLPRSWSSQDKFTHIALTQNNLRVQYKGPGKSPRDAASVRATHPIPAACGLYYFEVKIISKGRDGYMGIGLSTSGVSTNRLPGWDKNSYGYHGDDGFSFNASNSGQPYGPTFTTGDVIGCCVNLIENNGFYTKNGLQLGLAFTNIPSNLFPTVGLQTPGEIVEANFGQIPFQFDFDEYVKEWKRKARSTIVNYPINDWQATLQQLVCSYLIHYGYLNTAEALAKCTGQNETAHEDIASMKKRQCVQQLILSGRVEEAISTTRRLYTGLLERRPLLLFKLQCRNFIEMLAAVGKSSPVNGHNMREKLDDEDETEQTVDGDDEDESSTALERVLLYGRELQTSCNQLKKDYLNHEEFIQAQQQLHDAFSLLAYSEPQSSPVGHLLRSDEREPVSAALNSAILEEQGLPTRPPLELAFAHIHQCMQTMSKEDIGACAVPQLADIKLPLS